MTYNRAAIMKAAWVIVRRFLGRTTETLAQLLSRALKVAWWNAKAEAQVARSAATSTHARARLAERSAAELKAEIESLENRDTLGHDGLAHLGDLRAALTAAEQREAEDFAQKRELIASAKGRFAAVTFTKADGTERVMRVQPATLKFHTKGKGASESARRAAEARAERHPNLLPVWDAEKRAPRSVNLATVSRITVNGATHEFLAT